MAKTKKSKHLDLPPIRFIAAGQTDEERHANLQLVLPSPGFPAAARLVADAILKRSDITVMDFTPQIVNVRYHIDGIWHNMPSMDRETGDYMMASLKQLAGLNYRERRARQEGSFKASYLNSTRPCRLVSQGVKTGERIALYNEVPKPPLDSLEQLGMKSTTRAKLLPILGQPSGMVLFAAMPGEGSTSLWRAGLSACDRFMRDYYVIEEASRVEEEVINVNSITYDQNKGEDPFTPMPKLLLKEPNAIAFADVHSGKIIDEMCNLSMNGILIIARINAKHAINALLRLMVYKPNVEKLASQLNAVVTMRLVRKLCENCRVAYVPHPTMLTKLGLPVGSVRHMYKAFEFQPGMVGDDGQEIEVCTHCHGIGYRDQTGIFELLEMTDPIRQAMIETPRMDRLAAAAKAARHVSFRDMGIVAVASGITSLDEVQRVLKK